MDPNTVFERHSKFYIPSGDVVLPVNSFNFQHRDPYTPIAVSGVVRLVDKYLFEPLRKRRVVQVVQDWPTTLRDWDIHHAEMEVVSIACLRTMPRDDPDHGPSLPASIPEPASAIAFAQEFGCREILPAAFYQLVQIDVQLDWRFRGPDVGDPHSGPFRGNDGPSH